MFVRELNHVGESHGQTPFLKLREKWFYIGYIERIFQKTITSLQNYGKRLKLLHVSNL